MTEEPEGSEPAAEPDVTPPDMPGKLRTARTTRPTGRQIARTAPALLAVLTLGVTVAVGLWATKDSAAVIGPVSTWGAITAALIGTSLAVRSYHQSQDALTHSISISEKANQNRDEDQKRTLIVAANAAVAAYLASVHHFVNAANNLSEAISSEYNPSINSKTTENLERGEFNDRRKEQIESQFEKFKDSLWNTLAPNYYQAYLSAEQVSPGLATEIADLNWSLQQVGEEVLRAGNPIPTLTWRMTMPVIFDNQLNRRIYVAAMKGFGNTIPVAGEIWKHLQRVNKLPLTKIPEVEAGWTQE